MINIQEFNKMSEKTRTCMSNCKDPENRSKKNCTCGCHSCKSKNAKRNKKRRIPLEMALTLRKRHSVKDSKKTYKRKKWTDSEKQDEYSKRDHWKGEIL